MEKPVNHPVNHLEEKKLLQQLRELADVWRRSHDTKYVKYYTLIVDYLMTIGWNELLDTEAELPEEIMPEKYILAHPRV